VVTCAVGHFQVVDDVVVVVVVDALMQPKVEYHEGIHSSNVSSNFSQQIPRFISCCCCCFTVVDAVKWTANPVLYNQNSAYKLVNLGEK
jgi:hypothetical protein